MHIVTFFFSLQFLEVFQFLLCAKEIWGMAKLGVEEAYNKVLD